MRRIIVVLTLDAVIVTIAIMISTFGASASAQQSLCPPTGPSGGPATLVNADEPLGAGFVCLDEEAQEFFCPPEFELQLFRNPGSSPPFKSECVELSLPSDGGGTGGSGSRVDGGAELTQSGGQQSEAGDIKQTTNVS
jgi:hypothetical protein